MTPPRQTRSAVIAAAVKAVPKSHTIHRWTMTLYGLTLSVLTETCPFLVSRV